LPENKNSKNPISSSLPKGTTFSFQSSISLNYGKLFPSYYWTLPALRFLVKLHFSESSGCQVSLWHREKKNEAKMCVWSLFPDWKPIQRLVWNSSNRTKKKMKAFVEKFEFSFSQTKDHKRNGTHWGKRFNFWKKLNIKNTRNEEINFKWLEIREAEVS